MRPLAILDVLDTDTYIWSADLAGQPEQAGIAAHAWRLLAAHKRCMQHQNLSMQIASHNREALHPLHHVTWPARQRQERRVHAEHGNAFQRDRAGKCTRSTERIVMA